MLTLEPKVLIKLLTRTCTAALELAVAECVKRGHWEVGVRHMLFALLEDRGSDVSVLLENGGSDVAEAIGAVKRSLGELRDGNQGRPVFSPFLLETFQFAWRSVQLTPGTNRVRSAALLSELIRDPSCFAEVELMAQLSGMIPSVMKRSSITTTGSREDAETWVNEPRVDAPRPAPSFLPREVLVHRVAQGETLTAIARVFAIDVEDVARENNLGIHDTLKAGSILNLRVLPRDVVPRMIGLRTIASDRKG